MTERDKPQNRKQFVNYEITEILKPVIHREIIIAEDSGCVKEIREEVFNMMQNFMIIKEE